MGGASTRAVVSLLAWADDARKAGDTYLSTIIELMGGSEGVFSGSPLLGRLPIDVVSGGVLRFGRYDGLPSSDGPHGLGDDDSVVLSACHAGFDMDVPLILLGGLYHEPQPDMRALTEVGAIVEGMKSVEADILRGQHGRYPGLAESVQSATVEGDPFDKLDTYVRRVHSADCVLTRRGKRKRVPDGCGLDWIPLSNQSCDVLGIGEDDYVIMSTGQAGVGLFSPGPPAPRQLGPLDAKPVYRTRIDWSAGLVVWRREAAIIVRKAR